MFYITLNNQGGTHVSDITVKVEFVVEGGSSSVLYDSGPSPLPQLPVSGRHDVIVTTDIKEQGAIQLVASAVFTGELVKAAAAADASSVTWHPPKWKSSSD